MCMSRLFKIYSRKPCRATHNGRLSKIQNKVVFECNYKRMSLGVSFGSPYDKLLDFDIICAKYFIYLCKIKKNGLIFEHFKNSLYQEIETEKQIHVALNRDKLYEHQHKRQKII